MSKGHFRIISNVSFRKIYIGQRIESETDSWYQEAWDWMFFIFSASKKLKNEEKESECYMSWSATFHAKGKLRPTSSLLESPGFKLGEATSCLSRLMLVVSLDA